MHEPHAPISPLAKVLGSVYEANSLAYRHCCLAESRKDARFWDIVVVTACNQDQRKTYLQRIQRKLARTEIPRTAEYLVIEDPSGTKINSGGSTMYVMHTLQDKYKDRPSFLAEARILVIHAGGYSSRLPHVSACGKLFMAIPQKDSKGIEVFDIKLILYLHLLKTMPPGVFVTSADGIELLASKAPFPSSTQPLRITALAHPSPLNIATTHGVFELAAESLSAQEQGDMILEPQERSASLHRCLRFHHKPSMARLQDTPGLTFNNPRNHGEALAYTDSCYYFDPQTAIVLANLFPDLPRRCDLEAWADILDFQNTFHHASPASPTPQPLHPSIDLDNDHAHGRAMVHQALQQAGVQLELLVLNASQFYHLGTMTEFLDAVCLDVDFMATMGIENNVPGLGLVVADDGGKHRPVAGNDNEEEEEEDPQIIRSKDYTTTTITLQPPIFVQNSLLVSNNNALLACLPPWTMIIDTDLLASPQEKDNGGSAGHCNSNSNSPDDAWLPLATQQTFQGLPAGVCLFTLQLAADAFVTFSFSTKDDMKKPARTTTTSSGSSNSNSSGNHPETAPLQQQQQQQPWWETLCIFESIPVAKMLSPLFFAGNTESSDPVDENRSLWDAPIFEKAATKHESTLLALQRLARLTATTTTATTPTPSSSSSSSPSSPLARLLQKDVHVSGWISLKDAAEKARPYEIQG